MACPLLLFLLMLFVCVVVQAHEPIGRQNCCEMQGRARAFCCNRAPRRPDCCSPPPPPTPRNPPRPPRNCCTSDFPESCCAMSPRNTPCCTIIPLPPVPPVTCSIPVTCNLGATQVPLQVCVQAQRNCSSTSG